MKCKPFNFIKGIIKEGKRISGIVDDLLTFAREETGQFLYSDVSEIIRSSLSLLAPKINSSQINVQLDFKEPLPNMPIRPQKIQQVFLNILQNSIAALNEKFGASAESGLKKIIIQTSLFIDKDKKYGKISIIDNGHGIPKEILPKLFDPFFTTKPYSKEHGVGLGLSISYGIVKDHGGEIQIQSTWQKETVVDILLPLERMKVANN